MEKVIYILVVIGIVLILSGIITTMYILNKSDEIDKYVNTINDLKLENESIKRDYYMQKRELDSYERDNK